MNSLFLFDFTVLGVIKKFHSLFEFKVHSKKKVKKLQSFNSQILPNKLLFKILKLFS